MMNFPEPMVMSGCPIMPCAMWEVMMTEMLMNSPSMVDQLLGTGQYCLRNTGSNSGHSKLVLKSAGPSHHQTSVSIYQKKAFGEL